MNINGINIEMGKVDVVTTQNEGLSSDYWAERCMKHIMHISQDAADPIKQQAEAYREVLGQVVRHYMKQAVKSERTTIYNLLIKGGSADVAEHIRRM